MSDQKSERFSEYQNITVANGSSGQEQRLLYARWFKSERAPTDSSNLFAYFYYYLGGEGIYCKEICTCRIVCENLKRVTMTRLRGQTAVASLQ